MPHVNGWGPHARRITEVTRFQPSLRDWAMSRTRSPAMNRWAIIGRPYGTKDSDGRWADPILHPLSSASFFRRHDDAAHDDVLAEDEDEKGGEGGEDEGGEDD